LGLLKALFQVKAPAAQAFSDKILKFTVRRGNATNLRLLIDCGIDRSSLSGVGGGRHLQMALVYCKLDIAGLLLENEVDVNPPLDEFPHNEPPLHRVVQEGYLDLARRLIDAGANFHRKSVTGDTALASGLSYLKWANNRPIAFDCYSKPEQTSTMMRLMTFHYSTGYITIGGCIV